jgi:hypothetical protein
MLKIRKWDGGKTEVIVERYGYAHTHKAVSAASIARIEKLASGCKREFTRKYDATTTTIKL